ncbi:MAG: Short-chain dehydrogenase/reductase SDR?, partial [uncultured Nocardioides sp.]
DDSGLRRPRGRSRSGTRHGPALRRRRARGRARRADRGEDGAARRHPARVRCHGGGGGCGPHRPRGGDDARRGRDRAARTHRRAPLQPQRLAGGRRPAPHGRGALRGPRSRGRPAAPGGAGGGGRDGAGLAGAGHRQHGSRQAVSRSCEPGGPEGRRTQPRHQPRRHAQRAGHPGGGRAGERGPRPGGPLRPARCVSGVVRGGAAPRGGLDPARRLRRYEPGRL